MAFLVITASATISASVVLVDIMLYLKAFQTTGSSKRSIMYPWEDLRVFSSFAKNASLAIIIPFELCSFKLYWMLRNRWNQMYLNTFNAAVKCTRPGFIRKYDNFETAKAIFGLKSIAVYNKKPISF
jgi:hypothetical protein